MENRKKIAKILEKFLRNRPTQQELVEKGVLLGEGSCPTSPETNQSPKAQRSNSFTTGLRRIREFSFSKKKQESPTQILLSEHKHTRRASFGGPADLHIEQEGTLERSRSASAVTTPTQSPRETKKSPVIVRLDVKAPLARSMNALDIDQKPTKAFPTTFIKRRSEPVISRRRSKLLPTKHQSLHVTALITRMQSIYRGKKVRRLYRQRFNMQLHRTKVMMELVVTERSYLKSTKLLVENFLLPIRQSKMINPEDIKQIFSEIEVIHNIHANFLQMLEERYKTWSPSQLISPLFLIMSDFLKVYANYIKNYEFAILKLKELKDNAPFQEFCKDTISKLSKEYNTCELSDILVIPVQRLPRIKMMLVEFERHTWKDHRDYEGIRNAVVKIDKIIQFVNEEKRNTEKILNVVNIQNRISNLPFHLIQPNRELLRQGDLVVKLGTESQELATILFSDILLFAKSSKNKNEKWKYKGAIDLRKISFNVLNSKNIEIIEDETKISTVLHFNTTIDQEMWRSDISSAIGLVKKKEEFFMEHRSPEEILDIFTVRELPENLKYDIYLFQFPAHAKQYFEKHSLRIKGLTRRLTLRKSAQHQYTEQQDIK